MRVNEPSDIVSPVTKGGVTRQLVFREATAEDLPEVRRLQRQSVEELRDPLGVAEGSEGRSEFILLESVDGRGKRAVGMMSLMRASSAPFAFELAIPDVWERLDLGASTGRWGLRRDDIVEADWAYVEVEHRKRHLALTLWAGCMLLAHHRGYEVCIGLGSGPALAGLGDAAQRTGLSCRLGDIEYELVLLSPADVAPRCAGLVRDAHARDQGIVWRLPGLDR